MYRNSTLVPLAALIALLLCPRPVPAGTPEENKKVVLAMVEAVNARDLDALDALIAVDFQRHSGATPDLVIESRDQFKAFLEGDFAAVPDSVQTVSFLLAEGDKVALHATYAGTQAGKFGPFPASGKPVEVTFLGILRLEEGLISEIWVEWDNLNILTQLGHFPPPTADAPGTDPDGD